MDVAFISPAPPPTPSEPSAAPGETDEFALHLEAPEDETAAPDDAAPRLASVTEDRPRPQPAGLTVDAAVLFTHAVAPEPTPAPVTETAPAIGASPLPSEAALPPLSPQAAPQTTPPAPPLAPEVAAKSAPPVNAAAPEAPAPAAPHMPASPLAPAATPAQQAPSPSDAPATPPAARPEHNVAALTLPQKAGRTPATAETTHTPTTPSIDALETIVLDVAEAPAPTIPAVRAAPVAPAATPAPQQTAAPPAAPAPEAQIPAAPAPAPQAALATHAPAQRGTTAAQRADSVAAQPAQGPAAMAAEPPAPDSFAALMAAAPESAGAPSDPHTARSAHIATPAAQIAQQIVRRIDNGATRFELRLDPPELGRVDVRLELSRDHRVTALIAADDPATLAQLTRAAREIEMTLESAGLELTENGLSFDLTSGGQAERDTPRFSAGAHAAPARGPADADPPLARRALALESWRGARVDLVA